MIKKISILTDNLDSWIIPYIKKITGFLKAAGHAVAHLNHYKNICEGDILFILSCESIIPSKYLSYNKHNIVIHPSKLPYGKGWSPLAWQILDNKNDIPVTLFEASPKVDSGKVYFTDTVNLNGSELNETIKQRQGEVIIKMVKKLVKEIDEMKPYKQQGEEVFFSKRTKKDSELDINKSIKEQFNLLRVVDNERYPAYFVLNNKKYVLKIYDND